MRSGVMHQIRVHAAFLGVALLGDRRYGGGVSPEYFSEFLCFVSPTIGDWPKVQVPDWWPSWAHQTLEYEK